MGASNKIDDSLPGLSPCRAPRLCRSAPLGSIVDLRKLIAERFPQPQLPPGKAISTGLSSVDQMIGGGLLKGTITELISPRLSAGSASLIYALLQAANLGEYFIALVDGRDSFDPQPLGNSRLRNLLWVRCRQAIEAIKAADLLLRDGNFPLVIVDLLLNAREDLKIPQTSWYRLQRLVERAPTACLVLTRQSMISSAQLKIVLENSWSLETFEKDEAISRLRIQIQRSHLRSTMEPAEAERHRRGSPRGLTSWEANQLINGQAS
jgi:hypothetical protein